MKKFVLLTLLVVSSPALAWNFAGHMIVGAITYDVLKKNDPRTLEKLLDVLHHHPQWDVFAERLKSVDEADRDKYLLMIASRWPDDIRNQAEWTHPEWHYVDFQFVPQQFAGQVPTSQPAESNLLVALKSANAAEAGAGTPAQQAVAACWILHLCGDVQQPLHAVSMFSPDFPTGDKGGNSVYVKPEAGGYPVNLHHIWDALLSSTDKFQDASNIATELENRPEFAPSKLTELSNKDSYHWAHDESFPIAVQMAYLNGTLQYAKESSDTPPKKPTDAPELPPEYLKNAKAVAERRVILGGYRASQSFVDDLGN